MTALHAAGGGLPLALQIPHVVEQVGSVAGFVSVVGLAILSALYFSQARDLRRLREWAGRAPERAAEGQPGSVVPGRVVAVPQQPQQQRPAPQANGEAAKAEGDGAKPEAPVAATNGDAAPSVTAEASKDEQDKEEAKEGEAPAAKPGMPAPASAAAAAAGAGAKSVSGPAAAGAPASAPAATPSGPAGGDAKPAAPGAPASGGAATPGTPAAAGAAAAGSAAAPPKPGAPSGPQRPPGSVLPPRTGTLPPVRRLPSSNVGPAQTGIVGQPPQKKRNPVYIVLAVAGVLVLGAAAAIGVPKLVNGSDDNGSGGSSASASKSDTTTAKKKKAAPVSPDKITVAVLNGTTIPGLAAQVGDRVDAEGFTLGTVSNASQVDGQRSNSVVMYSSGHKQDAEQVAKQLNIRNVSRVDANSQSIAGDASVVVLVGSDKTQ